jgi:hypothetical protein
MAKASRTLSPAAYIAIELGIAIGLVAMAAILFQAVL